MADRISEDIRFYLAGDPYYFEVDNLPLKDLVDNDRILQAQIDELRSGGTKVTRSGILELQPYIDPASPGRVFVRSGSFIGRIQRSADSDLGGSPVKGINGGTNEKKFPPTKGAVGSVDYSVDIESEQLGTLGYKAETVGRTAVVTFNGGGIDIDPFGPDEFANKGGASTTPPLARIDLIGLTTVNGALDDPYLKGQALTDLITGNGYAKLAVVRGAGIVQGTTSKIRQVVRGEKYVTVGIPQEDLNALGYNLDGSPSRSPQFGTVPLPDDLVNICFSKQSITEALNDFAERNRNASFFLPLAYVFVPNTFQGNSPIPSSFLRDIRPIFRTAELTLDERQAIAASLNPSITNPVITKTHLTEELGNIVSYRGKVIVCRRANNSPAVCTAARLSQGVWTCTINYESDNDQLGQHFVDVNTGTGPPRSDHIGRTYVGAGGFVAGSYTFYEVVAEPLKTVFLSLRSDTTASIVFLGNIPNAFSVAALWTKISDDVNDIDIIEA